VDEAVAASTPVSWESDDGTRIEGRLFGNGSVGVVLAHMFPADQTSWYDFASTLADEGYTALTFNFRGYCPGGEGGCSGGERTIPEIWRDVASAASFLAGRDGIDRVVVVGASMGGTAALIVAASGDVSLAGVATLSAPLSFEGLAIDTARLASIGAPKLFVAGAQDGSAAEAAQTLFDGSNPPKDIEIAPVGDHGTDLLTGTRGEVVRRRLLTFLQLATAGTGTT
jgi:pimeloyl-ACP methyl ester carboxylesterase